MHLWKSYSYPRSLWTRPSHHRALVEVWCFYPQSSARKFDEISMGFLDVAISCGLGEVAALIINNPKYGSPTDEEVSRHWRTIISNSWTLNHYFLGDYVFGPERFDANQIFTIKSDETGNIVLTTPLHMCAATGFMEDQVDAIKALISNRADIHKRLPRRPGSQVHTLKPKLRQANTHGHEFEGTTPLEWAIEFSSVGIVEAILSWGYIPFGCEKTFTPGDLVDLNLTYAKALCRRQIPEMFSIPFWEDFWPSICDEDGNTMIHMICDYVETFWPNGDTEWTMDCIAERSGYSLVFCLNHGVEEQLRNNKGLSGTERVLEILKYSGTCEFRQTLARRWDELICYVEDTGPGLMVDGTVCFPQSAPQDISV
ncbi:hypothetical protein F5Y01DRAFT_51609 [Xylaria sp. FL0043]|nr:hypothetical protein F5Y01DRAFT_51609 [Xylaria sp. FL0043]